MSVTKSLGEKTIFQGTLKFFFARLFPLPFILVGAVALFFGGRSLYHAHDSCVLEPSLKLQTWFLAGFAVIFLVAGTLAVFL